MYPRGVCYLSLIDQQEAGCSQLHQHQNEQEQEKLESSREYIHHKLITNSHPFDFPCRLLVWNFDEIFSGGREQQVFYTDEFVDDKVLKSHIHFTVH